MKVDILVGRELNCARDAVSWGLNLQSWIQESRNLPLPLCVCERERVILSSPKTITTTRVTKKPIIFSVYLFSFKVTPTLAHIKPRKQIWKKEKKWIWKRVPLLSKKRTQCRSVSVGRSFDKRESRKEI